MGGGSTNIYSKVQASWLKNSLSSGVRPAGLRAVCAGHDFGAEVIQVLMLRDDGGKEKGKKKEREEEGG